MVFMQADGTIIATTDKLLSVLVSFPTRFWESGDSIDLLSALVNNTPSAAARTPSHTCMVGCGGPQRDACSPRMDPRPKAACNPTSGIIYTLKLHV